MEQGLVLDGSGVWTSMSNDEKWVLEIKMDVAWINQRLTGI
jgi:hypothetical protein